MRNRSGILPTFSPFLALLLFSGLCGQEGPEITVPTGPAISLDGTLETEEWETAARLAMQGGGEVLLRARGPELLVGIRGAGPGFPHVALSAGDSVWVLHASAALGTITYARNGGDRWRPVRGPVWEMRDTTLSAAARDSREAYLEEHGWVASTGRMGREGEAEFVIQMDRFGGRALRIAVASLVLPRRPQAPRWPDALPDDMNHFELLGGGTPEALVFRPSGWAGLILPDGDGGHIFRPQGASRLEKPPHMALPGSFLNALSFSPDGTLVAFSVEGREIQVWGVGG